MTGSFALKIPLVRCKKGSLSISISDFCIFAGLFLFGPHVAVAIALIEGTISSARVRIKRLYKYLFNMAQLAVATFAAGRLFDQLQGGMLWQEETLGLGGRKGAGLQSPLLRSQFVPGGSSGGFGIDEVARGALENKLSLGAALATVSTLAAQPFAYAFVLAVIPLILCTFYVYRIGLSRKRLPASC